MGAIIVLFAAFILLAVVAHILDDIFAPEGLIATASALAAISLILAVASTFVGLTAHLTSESYYEKKFAEYTVLQKMVDENSANTLIMMSDDIIDYNNDVISARLYHDNFWIGWLFSPREHELPLIEISE